MGRTKTEGGRDIWKFITGFVGKGGVVCTGIVAIYIEIRGKVF